MGTDSVTIGLEAVGVGELRSIADRAAIVLTDEVWDLIERSRALVDDAVARGDAIYGVTTGVGHARDERLPADALRQLQPMLVEMHLGGYGPPLEERRVRAAMAARLVGLARGGAGASRQLVEALATLLNHHVTPVIPSHGSVGSGDIGQLAYVGRVLLGRGRATITDDAGGSRQVDAGEALAHAGMTPVELAPKDALAMISCNAVTIGHGALLAERLHRVVDLADDIAALSMAAARANPSIVDEVVAAARPRPGQGRSADRIRAALEDAELDTASVQDPLSFRVVPQVHGAVREAVAAFESSIELELNARADNPLVDVDTGRIVSNGNFQSIDLAMAADGLRLALAQIGLLVDRRMGHLWDQAVTSLGMPGPEGEGPPDGPPPGPPAAGGPPPPWFAGLGLRYPGAARSTRLRLLAAPVSLDVPSLDLGQEDHSPNTEVALQLVDEAVDLVRELAVIEALLATTVLRMGPPRHPGVGPSRLLDQLDAVFGGLGPGPDPDQVHAAVLEALDG